MFARVVTATLDPSKASEFRSAITGQVESALKSQPGFLELLSLTSETDPNKVIAVSVWRSKQDIDNYASTAGQRVIAMVKPYIRDFKVETYSVDTGTGKRLSASAA